MSGENKETKWDLKQIGAGGGGVIALLFMFQGQGIDLMNEKQVSANQVIVEKTIANAERINRLEKNVQNLNVKIDNGFESIRSQIRQENGKLSDIIRLASSDRFTKSEHLSYKDSVTEQISRLQDQINTLRSFKTSRAK